MARLHARTTAFLQRLQVAAFANPFSDTRRDMDAALTSLDPEAPEVLAALEAQVSRVLDRELGRARLSDYPAEQQRLLRHAVFFEVFHTYASDFDEFIDAQGGESKPIACPLHKPLFRDLRRRGIQQHDHVPALEFFYQLRRAFRFLSTGLVGQSQPMRMFRKRLWEQLFGKDLLVYYEHLQGRMERFAVMLQGETGTGKSAAAAALGKSGFIAWEGNRFASTYGELFVPLHLAEHPGALLESALFGHVRGAFTGAINDRQGVLQTSGPHSVVFLDELGEIDEKAQVKLLRVLQERRFTPVGAEKVAHFSGRLIGATHASIDELVATGRMREDFFYRVCSDVVHVPTLDERLEARPEELDELVSFVIEKTIGVEGAELTKSTLQAIRGAPLIGRRRFPGNVRQLEQEVRRAILTGAVGTTIKKPARIAPDRSAADSSAPQGDSLASKIERFELTAEELTAEYAAAAYAHFGNYSQAGGAIGLDRRTLKRHVELHRVR